MLSYVFLKMGTEYVCAQYERERERLPMGEEESILCLPMGEEGSILYGIY